MTGYALADLSSQYMERVHLARRHWETNTPLGPRTGIRDLDRILGGHLTVGLHVIHGAPGTGKSALAQQIASTCGFPSLYITTEMARFELIRREIARTNQVPRHTLMTGILDPAEEQTYVAAIAAHRMDILDGCSTPYPARAVEYYVTLARRDAEHCLVVVDSLHSWAAGLATLEERPRSEYDVLNSALRDLVDLSARTASPIVVICERNRYSMAQGGLTASRGSGRIEYAAETVIDLSTDEHAQTREGWKYVTARVCKNRNGVAGPTVGLDFCGSTMTFKERVLPMLPST